MAEIDDNNNNKRPGELLSKARKKKGLSKAEISKRLNLSPKVIDALETDQYTDQIPDAFLRGYLRTYARAVGVNEDEVIALYSQHTGLEVVTSYYVPSEDVPPIRIPLKDRILMHKLPVIVAVILIVLLSLLGIALMQDRDEPLDETSSEAVVTVQEDAEMSSRTEQNPPVETQAISGQTAESVIEEVNDDSMEQEAAGDSLNAETDETSLPQGFIDTPVLNDAELEFTFIDDCWVQVTDSNDEVMAVGLKSAGRRFTVSGVPPISIVLGKPRAVSLQYNNQLVDLSIYPANQTARFTLGDGNMETQ